MLLFELLSSIVQIPDVLFVVKSDGAISEVRSTSLGIKQRENWITIGENDGPAHMHIDSTKIAFAEFIKEAKPERTSFSIMFFDENNKRILATFFTKMYDEQKNLKTDRLTLYENLHQKFGSKIQLK